MKQKYLLILIFVVGVVGLSFFYKKNVVPGGMLSVITEPNDGIAPVLALIRGASRSVDLVMYELDDAQIEAALAADEKRGLAVRIILSGGYKGASSTMNVDAYDFLVANDVPVRWSPKYFSLTHEKIFSGRRQSRAYHDL